MKQKEKDIAQVIVQEGDKMKIKNRIALFIIGLIVFFCSMFLVSLNEFLLFLVVSLTGVSIILIGVFCDGEVK